MRAGYVFEYCTLRQDTEFASLAAIGTAYLVFDVDFRYSPTLLCILGTYPQALEFSTCVVYVPPVELIFRRLRLIAEG